MAILYLVRHGETEWNHEGRIQGHLDPPLNAAGVEQASALAARLQAVPFAAAYTSDLRRAFQTAEILLAGRSVALVRRTDLRERYLGRWEGLRFADLATIDPDAWRDWLTRPRDRAPHGGETEIQLETRAHSAISGITTQHPTDTILLVSHGGTIRAALRALLGVEAGHTPNCGVYVIAIDGDRTELREGLKVGG